MRDSVVRGDQDQWSRQDVRELVAEEVKFLDRGRRLLAADKVLLEADEREPGPGGDLSGDLADAGNRTLDGGKLTETWKRENPLE